MIRWLCSFLIACLLAGCGSEGARDAALPKDMLVRLSDAEIRGLDPQKFSDLAALRVAQDQFEGLTRFDAAGEAEPGLAGDWTVSDDGLTWRFVLRDGLSFSDGTPIDAALFARLWTRLNEPATASPHTALFDAIEAVAAEDSRTVAITLKRPFPELPALLAHPAMAALPLHRIEALGDGWTDERPLVTSGPYRLADWRLNDRLELERNPRWHEDAAPVACIRWQPVDDPLAAMRLFLGGAADIAATYPQSRHEWLIERRPDAVRTGDYLGSYYFAFNTRLPPFDDARVRQALAMTVDRRWLAEALLPMGNAPAWGVVPPALRGDAGYRPEWADWPKPRREAAAQRLLVAAGYGPEHPLRFEIRINSSAEHRRMAVAMAAMWQPLNVEAQILNSEAALHFAALRRGEFQLARSGWIADLPAPENFLAVHRSDAGASNYSGIALPGFDAALDRAGSLADPDARRRAMADAEALLMQAWPVLPLYFYRTGALVGPRVTGWQDNAGNIHPSATLSLRQDRGEARP